MEYIPRSPTNRDTVAHQSQGDGASLDPVCHLLETGEVTDCRLIPQGSNHTFLARVVGGDGASCTAIYKPRAGERPLWDFPPGTLYLRECASYLVSQAIGWDLIPFTTIREGPHGVGALQLFIHARRGAGYYSLQPHHRDQLRRIAVFDLLANNADRKASHFLVDDQDKLWSIDHGLAFKADPTLRTVIWEFDEEPIPQPLLDDVARLLRRLSGASDLANRLGELLTRVEVKSLRQRLQGILAEPVFATLQRRWLVPLRWFRPWLHWSAGVRPSGLLHLDDERPTSG